MVYYKDSAFWQLYHKRRKTDSNADQTLRKAIFSCFAFWTECWTLFLFVVVIGVCCVIHYNQSSIFLVVILVCLQGYKSTQVLHLVNCFGNTFHFCLFGQSDLKWFIPIYAAADTYSEMPKTFVQVWNKCYSRCWISLKELNAPESFTIPYWEYLTIC